jgi:hypothetical protein
MIKSVSSFLSFDFRNVFLPMVSGSAFQYFGHSVNFFKKSAKLLHSFQFDCIIDNTRKSCYPSGIGDTLLNHFAEEKKKYESMDHYHVSNGEYRIWT